MSKQPLDIPITRTTNITDFDITNIDINYEEGYTEISYITYLENGDSYQRNRDKFDGTTVLDNSSLYDRIENKISTELS